VINGVKNGFLLKLLQLCSKDSLLKSQFTGDHFETPLVEYSLYVS